MSDDIMTASELLRGAEALSEFSEVEMFVTNITKAIVLVYRGSYSNTGDLR
jgi:hypothetical protein